MHQYRPDGSEVTPPPAFDSPDTTIDPGPDAIDPNDTVEQVRAPSGGTQEITYKVQSASTIDGAAAEPFAIAAAAPLDPLVSPTVRPDAQASPAGAVSCSTPVTISSTLANASPDLDASSAAVGIELPAGVELVSGTPTQSVSGGTLETGSTSEEHIWTVEATSDGSKVITIAGVGEAYDTSFRREDTVMINADCTPPGTTIDSGPAGPTNDATPRFTFSAQAGGGGFECAIDGGAFSPCRSPHALGSPLSDGPHTFRVRAKDAVGNVDVSPATRAFTVDTVAPDSAIISGPPERTRSSIAVFAVSATEESTLECSFDGRAFSPCQSPIRYGDLFRGVHTFRVRARDAAGILDPTPATRRFRVDRGVTGAALRGEFQRPGRRLTLRLIVGLGEPGEVELAARVRLAERSASLGPTTISLASAARTSTTLRASHTLNRRIDRALKRGRPVEIDAVGRFTDELGNQLTLHRTIRLRKGSRSMASLRLAGAG